MRSFVPLPPRSMPARCIADGIAVLSLLILSGLAIIGLLIMWSAAL